jgi:integrase
LEIHKALGDAVKLGKVPRNVADAVDKPSAAKPAHDIWTPEQLRAFLAEVREDRLYAMWLLFATTGMRRGEVAGLAWEDVDRLAAQVRINGPSAWCRTSRRGSRVRSQRPASV